MMHDASRVLHNVFPSAKLSAQSPIEDASEDRFDARFPVPNSLVKLTKFWIDFKLSMTRCGLLYRVQYVYIQLGG